MKTITHTQTFLSAGALVAACWFISTVAWPLQAAAPAAAPPATAAKRDATRCLAQADVDACNDAIRRNPSDPALLVALADGLIRAKRPADAIRHYRRAEALAPHMPGLAAKLSAAEKQLSAGRASVPARHAVQPAPRAPAYTNSASETQSH